VIARLVVAAAAGLALVACTAAPAATPTATPSLAPTASPSPTAPPTATATAAATPTAAASPTATPTPTLGPTPTIAPTASPGPTTAAGPAVECEVPATGGGVTIVDFGFQPTDVAVSSGQGVTWTNTGDFPHTVTFDDGPDCGRLSGGQSVEVIFREPGRYAYHCDIHDEMRGAVAVGP